MPGAETAKQLHKEAYDLALIQHKPKKALAKLAEALQFDRHYAEAALEMARVLLYCLPSRVHDAKVALAEYLSARPDSAYGYFLLGVIHTENKEFRKAEDAYRRSLQMDPSEMKSAASLGLLLIDQHRVDEGLPLLRQATDYIEATGGYCQGFLRLSLANALYRTGDTAGAIREWETVASLPEIWPEDKGTQSKAKKMLKKYSSKDRARLDG
jgi:eukaryotic-like serine/threonine-protein kinase